MMPGSLSTENAAARWSRALSAAGWRALTGCLAVGALGGLLAAQVRLSLGLPGHKVLFWMPPVLAAAWLYAHPAGATAGACAAATAALAAGGNLAGGWLFLPLVAAAGALLDATVALARKRRLHPAAFLTFFALAGGAANLLCALKRLLVPQKSFHVLLGLSGTSAQLLSYALFGLAAGLLGAAAALGVSRLARRGGGR